MAKTDIRLPAEFPASMRAQRLRHAAGSGATGAAAFAAFVNLLCYVRVHGDVFNGTLQFNGEDDEIRLLESEVQWYGEQGTFLKLCRKAGLVKYELNCLTIIDWTDTFGAYAQLDEIARLTGMLGVIARKGQKDTPEYQRVEAAIMQLNARVTNRSLEKTARTVGTAGTATPYKPLEPLEPQDHKDQTYIPFDTAYSGVIGCEPPFEGTSTPAPSSRNQKPETSRHSPPPAASRPGNSDTSKKLNSEPRSGNDYASPAWQPVNRFLADHKYTQAELIAARPFIRERLKLPFAKIKDGPPIDGPLFRLLAQMAIAKQLDADGQIKKDIWTYVRGCKGEPSDKAQAEAKREFLKLVNE